MLSITGTELCRVHGSADTSLARHGPRLAKWWASDPRLLHSQEEDLRHIPLLRVSPVQCAPRDGHHRIRGVAETGVVLPPCHDSLWCLGLYSHEVGAILRVDIAHISGLVATKQQTPLSLRALRRGHDDDAQVAAWSEGGDDLLQVLRGDPRHQGAHRHGCLSSTAGWASQPPDRSPGCAVAGGEHT